MLALLSTLFSNCSELQTFGLNTDSHTSSVSVPLFDTDLRQRNYYHTNTGLFCLCVCCFPCYCALIKIVCVYISAPNQPTRIWRSSTVIGCFTWWRSEVSNKMFIYYVLTPNVILHTLDYNALTGMTTSPPEVCPCIKSQTRSELFPSSGPLHLLVDL